MLAPTTFATIVDIGFVALVCYSSYRCIKFSGSAPEASSARQDELRELEGVLRTLIEEASAASRNLDRRLMERKRELEALVNKAEALNNEADAEEEEILINPHAASYRQSNYQRKAATSSRVAPEPASNKDFPNESWLEPLSWEQSNPKQSRTRSETARSAVNNQPTDGNYSIEELEGLLEQANRDQVSISQKSQAQFRKPVIKSGRISSAAPVKSKKLLKEDLELLIEKKRALKAGAGTGIVDETTLNIAIRLLKAGKEIHVVARKLDLSLAQVRLLDKNLRGESVAADEFEDTQHSNNSETFSPLHESIELESYDISAERELEDRNEVRGFKNQLRAYK